MKQHPLVTAYKGIDDLQQLKKWFYEYNDTIDHRKKAISKVKGLLTRGKLPHGVEATSLLTSIVLDDLQRKDIDSCVLQLSYTMALIRFVNGLLDPYQQSNYAIPMHLLAKQLNLPTYFVELRHMGTHENLPSLDILRSTCSKALTWLYDNYWCHVEEANQDKQVSIGGPLTDAVEFRSNDLRTRIEDSQIYNNLKAFKRIRKQDLNKVYEKNDTTSDLAATYHRCVLDIVEFAKENCDLLVNVLLLKNYLIYPSSKVKDKKLKFNPLIIKLYEPLFDALGLSFKLKCFSKTIELIEGIPLSFVDKKVYRKLGFTEKFEYDELFQVMEWVLYFMQDLLRNENVPLPVHNKNELVILFLDSLKLIEQKIPQSLLPSFAKILQGLCDVVNDGVKSEIDPETVQKLDAWNKLLNNLHGTKKIFELPPSLDDLLGLSPSPGPIPETTSSNPMKHVLDDDDDDEEEEGVRRKQHHSSDSKTYILKPHKNWRPVPFGTCI